MCKVSFTLFLYLLLLVNVIHSEDSFIISQFSRPIQVDALLMEWNSYNSKTLNSIVIDAALTPKYLTGYIRFDLHKNVNDSKIGFLSHYRKFEKYYNLDTSFQLIEVALEVENKNDSTKTAIMEWQFPISDLGTDSLGNINLSVLVIGRDSSKIDTLEIESTVFKNDSKKDYNLIIRIILISILLIIFIFMKKKVSKRFSA